jgi:hypothetical protein
VRRDVLLREPVHALLELQNQGARAGSAKSAEHPRAVAERGIGGAALPAPGCRRRVGRSRRRGTGARKGPRLQRRPPPRGGGGPGASAASRRRWIAGGRGCEVAVAVRRSGNGREDYSDCCSLLVHFSEDEEKEE